MQTIRLLIYEGSPAALAEQLGNSMGDGIKPGMKGCTITAITLGKILDTARIAYLTNNKPKLSYTVRDKEEAIENLVAAAEKHAFKGTYSEDPHEVHLIEEDLKEEITHIKAMLEID